jgi:hypothetical protein
VTTNNKNFYVSLKMSVFKLNESCVATTLLLLIVTSSQFKVNCVHLPKIYLGEVHLDQLPNCDQQLRPLRHNCELQYVKSVNETLRKHKWDITTESVRRATCCGIWRARDCVANAAISISECGEHVAKLYRELPTNPEVREEVADMCSEYDESAPICSNSSIFYASVWNLLSFSIFRIVIDL